METLKFLAIPFFLVIIFYFSCRLAGGVTGGEGKNLRSAKLGIWAGLVVLVLFAISVIPLTGESPWDNPKCYSKAIGGSDAINCVLDSWEMVTYPVVGFLVGGGMLWSIGRLQPRPNQDKKSFVSSLFRVGDLENLTRFAVELREASDPLSQFLKEKFSPNTKKLLEDYKSPGPLSPSLQIALIKDLTSLVGENSLYDEQGFIDVKLREKTSKLNKQNPQGWDLISLNRLLLEDGYPHIIAKSHWDMKSFLLGVLFLIAVTAATILLYGYFFIPRMQIEIAFITCGVLVGALVLLIYKPEVVYLG